MNDTVTHKFANPVKIERDTFEQTIVKTLFKGTFASREDIRDKLTQFADRAKDVLAFDLGPDEIAEYVNRVRLYQEEYRQRSEAGYIGVGLIFDLPRLDQLTTEGQAWLHNDLGLK